MFRIGDRDLPDPLSLRRARRIRLPRNDHALGRDGDVSRDLANSPMVSLRSRLSDSLRQTTATFEVRSFARMGGA